MVPDVVRRYLQRYRDAFVRFHGAEFAASYYAPSIMARRDSYVLWAIPDVTAHLAGTVDCVPFDSQAPADMDR
jgi:hypothetical protein